MLWRLTLFLVFVSISKISGGQTKTSLVLSLKDKQYYSEQNILLFDSTPILIHELCYDEPNTVDEEHCIILKFIFLDTGRATQLKTIDVAKDTSVIKCLFDIHSVWNWSKEKYTITGFAKILTMTKKSIGIRLDITIYDERHIWTYIYKGERTFKKIKGKTSTNGEI